MPLFQPGKDEAPEWAIAQEVVRESTEKASDKWVGLATCPVIEVYTDGSAPVRNPGGQAGSAAVLVGYYVAIPADAPERPTPAARLDLGGYLPARSKEPQTSNNRAEIGGLLLALESLRHLARVGWVAREVTVWSDSRYAVMCANREWKRHKNTDLWSVHDELAIEVLRSLPKKGYALRWVRGHAGNEYNEAADELATLAAFNFDRDAYARLRAAQAATGKEMPGEASGDEKAEGRRQKAEGESVGVAGELPLPAANSRQPAATQWLKGADYALAVQTVFKVLDQSAATGMGVGKYRIWAKDGRSREGEVEHDGQHLHDELEYRTLIAALEGMAKRFERRGRDPKEFGLLVLSGRELMVKQLRGEYKVKAEALQGPYREASALLRRFKWAEIEWKRGREMDEVMREGPV